MPKLVRDYNFHMGGVDLSNMRTYIFRLKKDNKVE